MTTEAKTIQIIKTQDHEITFTYITLNELTVSDHLILIDWLNSQMLSRRNLRSRKKRGIYNN